MMNKLVFAEIFSCILKLQDDDRIRVVTASDEEVEFDIRFDSSLDDDLDHLNDVFRTLELDASDIFEDYMKNYGR